MLARNCENLSSLIWDDFFGAGVPCFHELETVYVVCLEHLVADVENNMTVRGWCQSEAIDVTLFEQWSDRIREAFCLQQLGARAVSVESGAGSKYCDEGSYR